MWLKTVFPIILLSWICVAQSGKSVSSLNRKKQFYNYERSSAHKNEVANVAEFHTIDHKSRKLLFWNSTKKFIEKLKGVGPLLKSKVRQKIRQIQLNMRSDLISVEKMRKMREKYGPLGEGRITGTFPPLRTTEDWRPRYNKTTNKYHSSGNAYNQQRNYNSWSPNNRNYHQNNYNNAVNRNRYNSWQQKDHSNQHSRQNYNNNFDRKTGSEHQRSSSSFVFQHQHSNYNERFRSHAGVSATSIHSCSPKRREEHSEDVYEHSVNATDSYDFTDSEEISTFGNILDLARKVSKYHKRYFTTTPQHITGKNTFSRNGSWGSKLIATSKEPGDHYHQQQQRLHHRQQGQQQQHRHQEQQWQSQQGHHKQQQQTQQQQSQQQHQGQKQQPHQQHQDQQQQSYQRYQDQQQQSYQRYQDQQQQSYQRYQDQQQQLHERHRDQQQQSQQDQQQQQQQRSTLIQTSPAFTSTVSTNFSTFHKTTNSYHENGSTVVYNTTERSAVTSDIELNRNTLKSTSSATNFENLQQRQYQFTTIPTSTASTVTVSTTTTTTTTTTSQQVNISTAVYNTTEMSVIPISTESCEVAQKNNSSTTLVDSFSQSDMKRHHYYTGQWTKVFSSSVSNGTVTVANLSNTNVEINTAQRWKTKTNIPQWGSVNHQTRQSLNKTTLDTNTRNRSGEEAQIERRSTVDDNHPEMFTGRSHLKYFNATLNPHYNADHTRRYAKRAYQAVSEALMNASHQANHQNEVTVSYFQNPSTWVAGFFGPITKIARINTGTFSAPHRIVQRLGYSKPPLPEWGTPLYKDQERSYQTRQPTYTEKITQFSHRFFAGTFNPHYNVPTTRPTKETDARWYSHGRSVSSRRATRINEYTIRDRYFTPKKAYDRHHHHHHHHQHVPLHKQTTFDYNVKHNFKTKVTEMIDYNVKDPNELAPETTTIDYNTKGTATQIITTTINYNTVVKPKHKVQPRRFSPHRTAKTITWTPFHKFLHTRYSNQTAWTRKKIISGNRTVIIKTERTPSFSTGTWSFSDYTPLTTLLPSSVTTELKRSQTVEKSQIEHVTNKTARTELHSTKITPTEIALTSEKKASTIADLSSSTTIPTIKVVPKKISSDPLSATTLKRVTTQPKKRKKTFSTTNETKTSTRIASKKSSSTRKRSGTGRKRKSSTTEFADKTATTPTKPGSLKKSTRKTRPSRNTRRKGPYPTAPVIYYDEMEHINEL